MSQSIQKYFDLADEIVGICCDLKTCLFKERDILVHFKLEELLQNNVQKESLISLLVSKKRDFQGFMQSEFGSTKPSELQRFLVGKVQVEWLLRKERWDTIWRETLELCRRNQTFIDQSQKSLNAITENLKQLFFSPNVYTQAGRTSEVNTKGKVIEGQY